MSLVQHSDHFDGDNKAAKEFYESGMAATFQSAHNSLIDNGTNRDCLRPQIAGGMGNPC